MSVLQKCFGKKQQIIAKYMDIFLKVETVTSIQQQLEGSETFVCTRGGSSSLRTGNRSPNDLSETFLISTHVCHTSDWKLRNTLLLLPAVTFTTFM